MSCTDSDLGHIDGLELVCIDFWLALVTRIDLNVRSSVFSLFSRGDSDRCLAE